MKKKVLTREEEADEIIRRLSTPPIRTLTATWTIEMLDDITSQHGLDIEKELAEILSREIDREILEEMNRRYGKGNI